MFKIRIAGIIVEIEEHCPELREKCRGYIVSPLEDAEFRVEATEEEISSEALKEPGAEPDVLEAVCVYRQMCYKLMEYGAFVLHAALLDFCGTGIAIIAPSRTGKTTLAWNLEGQFEGVRIINGDKPILRIEGNRIIAYGTPWNGKENIGCNSSVELRKLCFLEQGKEEQIRKIELDDPRKLAGVTEQLLRQMLLPNEADRAERFFAFVERVLDHTEIYCLKCTESVSAALFAARGMGLC